MWSMHGEGERKFVWGNLGHMTKVTSNPIYGYKILENFLKVQRNLECGIGNAGTSWSFFFFFFFFFLYMMKGKFSG